MTTSDSSFSDISRGAVRAFVQTIVIVDDKAFTPEPLVELPISVHDPDEIEGSTSHSTGMQGDRRVGVASVESEVGVAESGSNAEALDARTLIRLFAKVGLVCAVIQPEKDDDLIDGASDVARRADVVVLDWLIHGDHGNRTRSLIKRILEDDASQNGRLRLFAIYTGSPNLRSIIATVREHLESVSNFQIDSDGLAIIGQNLRITALAKSGTSLPKEDAALQERIVDITELPERLYREFSEMTSGLASNVALKSLAVLRENTHAILGHVRADLDAAFLAHRLLLPEPDDANEHAVDLVAGELTALLHAFEVGGISNAEAVEAWIRRRNDYKFTFAPEALDRDLSTDVVVDLVTKGLAKWKGHGLSKPEAKRLMEEFFKGATELFVSPPETARQVDCRFAIATSLSRRYRDGQPEPRMTLGTIIKNDSDETYCICIQPRCDCVRVEKKGRDFVFIQAVEISNEASFDLVIDDYGSHRRLKIRDKPQKVRMLRFQPTGDVVRSVKTQQGWHTFTTCNDQPTTYRWFGQLKDAHAQRISNAFAARLSRVGLDESEWLRRWAGVDE